ncbi:hypothetical protein J4E81_002880 [Alternaria sp. BMP 2799]|nr:hypothetical protein J4E81_002880 [Alternaria sp. BMP 2799]
MITPELEIQHIVDPETKEKIYYLEVNNRGFEEDLVGKDKEPIEALRNLHGNIEGKLEDARKGRKGQKIKGQRLIDVEVAESE